MRNARTILLGLAGAMALGACADRPLYLPEQRHGSTPPDLGPPDLARSPDLAAPPDLSSCTQHPTLGGNWRPISTVGAPKPGGDAVGVWTGQELLVVIWGQIQPDGSETGGVYARRYDPVADSWRSMSTTGGANVSTASAVWTGQEMIVWGGDNSALGDPDTGAAYDPVADHWRTIATTGAPSPRLLHTAVWTGTRMLVWGGEPRDATGAANQPTGDGAAYDPASDRWTPISTVGAPVVYSAVAAWTGKWMLIWGGIRDQGGPDGYRYDPVSDVWQPMSTVDQPGSGIFTTSVWTGSQLLVWGGGPLYAQLSSGASYDPESDRWVAIPDSSCDLSARSDATVVWADTQALFLGGIDDRYGPQPGGAAFAPATQRWAPLPVAGAPSPRWSPIAAWTGSEMLIWGGICGNAPNPGEPPCSDGAAFAP